MTTDGDNMGDLQRSGGPILHWKQASEKVYWPPVIPLSCQQPRHSDEAPQIPSRCLRRDLSFPPASPPSPRMNSPGSNSRRAGIAVPDNRLVEMSEIKGLPEEGRAAAAWNGLEQADLLPKDQRASVGKQILRVAARVK
jgi:hypothetical protein